MFASNSQIAKFVVAALGGRNASRLGIGFILGYPLKMIVDGIHSAYPSSQFLAAINGYEVIYFGLLTTALVFSPVLIGRQFVADRSLGDVQTINFLLANAQLDEAQKKEFWLQYLNKTIQTLDPRLDEDIKKYLETRKE